ncbi:kinase-like domain-containing protein [Ustulina deusta]|nr:kinase-like domain-containing protein [Ustulina deusta]
MHTADPDAKKIRIEGDAFCIRREAGAMELVRQNTSLPAPAIYQGTQSHIHTPNRHLNQLHNLHLPALGWIGFCSRGMAFDHRLTNPSTYGPSESVGAFYDFLVALALVSLSRSWLPRERVDEAMGDIIGIIDWKMTCCWLAWWEYRKAVYGARNRP